MIGVLSNRTTRCPTNKRNQTELTGRFGRLRSSRPRCLRSWSEKRRYVSRFQAYWQSTSGLEFIWLLAARSTEPARLSGPFPQLSPPKLAPALFSSRDRKGLEGALKSLKGQTAQLELRLQAERPEPRAIRDCRNHVLLLCVCFPNNCFAPFPPFSA